MKAFKLLYTGLLVGTTLLLYSSCVKKDDNTSKGVIAESNFVYVLHDIYHGNEITLNTENMGGASNIQAVVISDKATLNIEPGTFVVQQTVVTGNQVGDVTRGIVVRLASGDATYALGDSLSINVIGAKLDRVNGKLAVSGLTTDKINKVASNRTPLVRQVTLAMLATSMDQYESTLVSVHGDVTDYGPAVTFNGERKLSDNTGAQFFLRTRAEATFAASVVPVDAQFTGIAGYHNETGKDSTGAKKIISLRNSGDINFGSGALYAGFPESFETPDFSVKTSYNVGTNAVDLATGNWTLLQAILANTVIRDKYNLPGKQCVRMQQNLTTSATVQMNFNVPDGASKVTLFYGKYFTDPTSTFRLEYSVNNGTTWTQVGANVTDMPDRGFKQATFTMNIAGPVRFRINKLGLGTSSASIFNGRLCIEDIAIYKKL